MNEELIKQLKELVEKSNLNNEITGYVVGLIKNLENGDSISNEQLDTVTKLIENEVKKKEILSDFTGQLSNTISAN